MCNLVIGIPLHTGRRLMVAALPLLKQRWWAVYTLWLNQIVANVPSTLELTELLPSICLATPAPAEAHSESAYDFPGPTLVPALLSRPFLDACYHSALATSSASATASASTLVTSDRLPAPSLRPCCTFGNKGIAYTPSRSTAVRCGALGNGSTTYALHGLVCRV